MYRTCLGGIWFAICLLWCSPLYPAEANILKASGVLAAKILPQTTSPDAEGKAGIQVEIRNASGSAIVLAMEDILRSYFFTTESKEEISFRGEAEGGIADRNAGGIYCPGDVPTFVVGSGQVLVQVIRVPIPKSLRGKAKLEVVLRLRRLQESLRCGLAEEMNVEASGVVTVNRDPKR